MLSLTNRHNVRSSRCEHGFTLIEILVAMLIFAVGLLGLAGMLSKSMAVTQASYTETVLALQASDFNERLRANTDQSYIFDASQCTGASATLIDTSATPTTVAPLSADCSSVSCTATELKTYDIEHWCKVSETALGNLFVSAAAISISDSGVPIGIQLTVSLLKKSTLSGTPETQQYSFLLSE